MGPYRPERLLGEGGMGRVLLARRVDEPDAPAVALKVVHRHLARDAAFRTRFRHEVAAARAVDSRFVVPMVDADTDAADPWLATAYVPGPSLAQAIAATGPLSEERLGELALALASALADIHAAGLVHRDLKPSNVLIHPDAGPLVIDLGIARAADATRLTVTGMVIGTPGYMAPEQFTTGASAPTVDVFALGAVLAFAATGRRPFGEGSAHRIGYRTITDEPDLTDCPESWLPLIGACLTKDPAVRPTVPAVLAALAGGPAPHLPATPAPAAPPPAAPSRFTRRRRVALAAGLALVLVGGVSAVALRGGDETAGAHGSPSGSPPAPVPSGPPPLPQPTSAMGPVAAASDWSRAWQDLYRYDRNAEAEWKRRSEWGRAYAMEVWLTGDILVRVGNDEVRGLAPSSGKVLWTLKPPAPGMVPCRASHTVSDGVGVVVFGSRDEPEDRPGHCDRVVAVDIATGSVRWERRRPGDAPDSPGGPRSEEIGVTADRVVAKSGDLLTAWRLRDGEQVWQYDGSAENCALDAIAVGQSTVAAALTCPKPPGRSRRPRPTVVRSLNAADGSLRWSGSTPGDAPIEQLETAEPVSVSVFPPPKGLDDLGPMLVFDDNGRPGPLLRATQDFGPLGAWPRNREQISPRVFGWKDTVVTTTDRGESGNRAREVVAVDARTGRIRWHVPVRPGYIPLVAGFDDDGVLVLEWGPAPALVRLSADAGRARSAGTLSGGAYDDYLDLRGLRASGGYLAVFTNDDTMLFVGVVMLKAAGGGPS
ncbi:protein kinase domain-containing protein [Embleya sp. NBC_00896]|uniref:serine/threonine-protein kinase n=1 Tax=Embleya sp. NBC_00896 TaxID=2975961 RepID=UPI00387053E1|nr:serine/threonine-protein kinase [Embleya sp. NBC_00896]